MKKIIIKLTLVLTVLCHVPILQAQVQFSEQKVIISYETSTHGASDVYSADLDGDGDLDVLSASSGDEKIAWYENDGAGSFSAQQVITTNAWGACSVYACDLDGDNDLDVLSASSSDDKIAWYENLLGTTIENNTNIPLNYDLYQNYPNPFNPETTIEFVIQEPGQVRLSVFNILGQEVAVLVEAMKSQGSYKVLFDATKLTSGVYFYKLKTKKGEIVRKMVLLQ